MNRAQRPMRDYQAYKHTCNWPPKKRREKNESGKIFEEIMATTPQICWEILIYTSSKLNKYWLNIYRDPHVDTS